MSDFYSSHFLLFFYQKLKISKQEGGLFMAITEAEAGVQAEVVVTASKGVFLIPDHT